MSDTTQHGGRSETPMGTPTARTEGSAAVRVITLGCRLNAYESEVMHRHALDAGIGRAIIVNTCAVTAEAVRQAGQTVRRLRREDPTARIIVTGCAAQLEPERFAAIDGVDHVVGNAEKLDAATFHDLAAGHLDRIAVNDIMRVRETAGHLIDGFGSRARAYVEIQNGCDHRCTFCIIPFARGPSRSAPAGAIVDQVRRLVAAGYQEVVLTGVDITAYGADLPGEATLGRLVRQILRHVPELPRLRLSSIDQVEVDRHLLDAIASEDRLMPHFHLSMQSGDDMILKRIKRRHLRADAIRFCADVRSVRPDVVFGADLIAGFPTETEPMFDQTLDIVDTCGLTYLHVFPYSRRPGTPAARMPQVAGNLIKERAGRLRSKGRAALEAYFADQIGRVTDVLMERDEVGRTPQFAEVSIASSHAPGHLVPVTITGHDGARLSGEVRAR